MEFVGKNNCFSTYLSLFLLGTILLFFRSAYSFITPYLYAEDGSWIFQIINDGFLHTFVNQRYFMTGYLILEEISIWINKLLFGYNLRYLPDVISVIKRREKRSGGLHQTESIITAFPTAKRMAI